MRFYRRVNIILNAFSDSCSWKRSTEHVCHCLAPYLHPANTFHFWYINGFLNPLHRLRSKAKSGSTFSSTVLSSKWRIIYIQAGACHQPNAPSHYTPPAQHSRYNSLARRYPGVKFSWSMILRWKTKSHPFHWTSGSIFSLIITPFTVQPLLCGGHARHVHRIAWQKSAPTSATYVKNEIAQVNLWVIASW